MVLPSKAPTVAPWNQGPPFIYKATPVADHLICLIFDALSACRWLLYSTLYIWYNQPPSSLSKALHNL